MDFSVGVWKAWTIESTAKTCYNLGWGHKVTERSSGDLVDSHNHIRLTSPSFDERGSVSENTCST